MQLQQNWKANFFLIWAGQALSEVSSSVLQFAIVWHLTSATGSPLVLSAAMLAGFLPRALIGPFAGVVIDRYHRKFVMITADAFIALISLALAIADMNGTSEVWLIMVILVLRAVGTAFHQPCMQAVTPQIVPRDMLTRCAGYSQTLKSVSSLLSPGIAAVLYGVWELNAIILLDVAGAGLAIAGLLGASIPKLPPAEKKKPRAIREAMEGLRLLREKKGIYGLVGVNLLYAAALVPISAYFPLMCMSYFHGTTTDAGMVEALFSAGLLVGSLLLGMTGGFRDRMKSVIASCLLMGVCLIAGGLLPPAGLYAFAATAFFMGICGPNYWGSQTAILQRSFPNEVLGRILSLSDSIRMIATPVSLIVSSFIAERYGPGAWFLIGGALVLVAASICMGVKDIRLCDSME